MYCIRRSYRPNPSPEYASQRHRRPERTWQPDVYEIARRLADVVCATAIIDAGCGDGAKLVSCSHSTRTIGIDFGDNIVLCRTHYPEYDWREQDMDANYQLPVTSEELADSVVICSDVIEHLLHPDRLVAALLAALESGAAAVLISTPERELTSHIWEEGPPRNPRHVREWSMRELEVFLRRTVGYPLSIGLTRSDDRHHEPHTILAVMARDEALLEQCCDTLLDFVPTMPSYSLVTDATRRIRAVGRILVKGE